MTVILGIESSCDETACAIVRSGTELIASTLATSYETHQQTGGVIPEVAARKQLESIIPIIDTCLKKAQMTPIDIDSIAVTVGPGLIGSLLVGVETAKVLSYVWDKPLIPVNHLIGHIYGNFIDLDLTTLEFPILVLIVSGGHTDLVLMKNHGEFEYIGGTLDDASGEAFDKVARLLGLAPFMGGPYITKAAKEWLCSSPKPLGISFKRPMINSGDYNFSFSGIKTAVLSKVNEFKKSATEIPVGEIAYEFQEAVTDVLVEKTINAANEYGVKSIMLGGGVSTNTVLREKILKKSEEEGINLRIPPISLCTDNAIYIASAAFFNNTPKPLDQIKADPSLSIMSKF